MSFPLVPKTTYNEDGPFSLLLLCLRAVMSFPLVPKTTYNEDGPFSLLPSPFSLLPFSVSELLVSHKYSTDGFQY
jgi:hypothetical protein